jgi:hypothetical protein
MVSTMKPTIALAFAVVVGAAAPASAQVITQEGTLGVAHEAFPFAYVNAPGPNGQCWVMSDRTMGYGYWGKCPEGVAAAPAPTRQRQARSARAAAAAPAAASTGFVAAPGPAPAIEARATVASPAGAAIAPAPVAPAAGPVITEAFPFAYVSSPAADGQCWVLSDRTMGYGYWGKCP